MSKENKKTEVNLENQDKIERRYFKRFATKQEKAVFLFLTMLKISGITNMFGAVPYITKAFPDIHETKARELLSIWMHNFNKEGRYDIIELEI